MRHLLTISELSPEELQGLIDRGAQMDSAHKAGRRDVLLGGRLMALFFEKPSLRTRVSFEAAMAQLGGACLFIQAREIGLGTRESIPDFARVISQYVDVLVARVFDHRCVVELAGHASVPVINGLSDASHPCQALGDLLTIQQLYGQVEGCRIVFVGDGTNVARSLATGCRVLGAHFVLASPKGYEFSQDFLEHMSRLEGNGSVAVTNDPRKALAGAQVVYTDVWTSMGQEAQRSNRARDFAGFQINAELIRHAPPAAKVMHCLPANRGEEISDELIDGPQSVVIQQAANRLHAQKGLLLWLLEA